MANETIEHFKIHTQHQIDALNHSINLIISNRSYVTADGRIENFSFSSNLIINANGR